jgi:hypothetical protein
MISLFTAAPIASSTVIYALGMWKDRAPAIKSTHCVAVRPIFPCCIQYTTVLLWISTTGLASSSDLPVPSRTGYLGVSPFKSPSFGACQYMVIEMLAYAFFYPAFIPRRPSAPDGKPAAGPGAAQEGSATLQTRGQERR